MDENSFLTDQIRYSFNIAPDEICMYEYKSTLKEKHNFQGHVFIFFDSIYFYSSNMEKSKSKELVQKNILLIIKYNEIKEINKKKFLGMFGNHSIQIVDLQNFQYILEFEKNRDQIYEQIVSLKKEYDKYIEQQKEEELWMQEALIAIQEMELKEQTEKNSNLQQIDSKTQESQQFSKSNLFLVHTQEIQDPKLNQSLIQIEQYKYQLDNPMKLYYQIYNQVEELRNLFNGEFINRENYINKLVKDKMYNRYSFQEIFIDDITAREIYILFFSNQQFEFENGKIYPNFFSFYLTEFLFQQDVTFSEISPVSPKLFENIYNQDIKQLMYHSYCSSREVTTKMQIKQKLKEFSQINDKIYWTSPNKQTIIRSIQFKNLSKCENISLHLIYEIVQNSQQLNGDKPKFSTQIRCGMQVEFRKMNIFQGQIREKLDTFYMKCYNELRNLMINTSENYKEKRSLNPKDYYEKQRQKSMGSDEKNYKEKFQSSSDEKKQSSFEVYDEEFLVQNEDEKLKMKQLEDEMKIEDCQIF